jgi:predicted AAA+ superfamily ATPase
VRSHFHDALTISLLATDSMLRYERDPAALRAEVVARPRSSWIVIDEVQRAPRLLDEVHFLMEEKGYHRFVITGSSARKLKRGAANLLAGRAIVRHLFPLTAGELSFSVPADQMLRFGTMPLSVNADDDDAREEFLRAYVSTYLAEEVKAEALVRDLGAFSRFLEVASLAAGQKTNVSAMARDASVARDTVRGYFDVLVDTLIGAWLPAYRPRAKVKEVALPKFYWFDSGILHAAAGGFDQPLPGDWDGVLLEHLIHRELRSRIHYANIKGSLGYWATPSGSEVDFIWWHGRDAAAIEVKNGREFRRDWTKGIDSFRSAREGRAFIVYRGTRELRVDDVRVLPLMTFLRLLHSGDILR